DEVGVLDRGEVDRAAVAVPLLQRLARLALGLVVVAADALADRGRAAPEEARATLGLALHVVPRRHPEPEIALRSTDVPDPDGVPDLVGPLAGAEAAHDLEAVALPAQAHLGGRDLMDLPDRV